MAFPGVTHGPRAEPYIRIAELRTARVSARDRRYADRARGLAQDKARAAAVIDRVSLSASDRVAREMAENNSLKDEMQAIRRAFSRFRSSSW